MARTKNGVNKSKEIRDLLEQTPGAAAADIVAVLAERGIKATTQDVYNARSTLKTKGKKGRRRGRAAAPANGAAANGATPAPAPRSSDAVQVVLHVTNLAKQIGGMRQLKRIVDALVE